MPTAEQETTTMAVDAEVMPDIAAVPGTGLVRRSARDVVLMPVQDIQLAKKRLAELQEFCESYLHESKDGGNDGGDYGIIPGAGKKKNLLKSGADKLCDIYGLADRYVILSKVEDFVTGLFDYNIQCELYRKTDEMFVGSGLGSCSSYESKYRWRQAQRVCPKCGKDAIIRGKEEYGGGWLCFRNKGGCGEKYAIDDELITNQKLGRIENPDICDQKNTVIKMAKKRAKIDAVISVTRSSGLFTQDLDDKHDDDDPKPKPSSQTAPAQTQQAKSSQTAKPETQAEKIARVRREQEEKQKKNGSAPQQAAPPAEPKTETAPAATPPPTNVPEGSTLVKAINVKNGSSMKNGVNTPWTMFVIRFGSKVQASDGVMVIDATTFSETLAGQAEKAKENETPVKPVVKAGSRKGSYTLESLGE